MQPRHISNRDCNRTRSTNPTRRAGIRLNSPQRTLVDEECRFQCTVVPPEPNSSPGLVVGAAVIWKFDHEIETDQTLAVEPRVVPALERPATQHGRWSRMALTGDARRSDMRLVSVIYRIWRGVCAAAKGMQGQYDCAPFELATRCRITRLARCRAENKLQFSSLSSRPPPYERYHRAPLGCYR